MKEKSHLIVYLCHSGALDGFVDQDHLWRLMTRNMCNRGRQKSSSLHRPYRCTISILLSTSRNKCSFQWEVFSHLQCLDGCLPYTGSTGGRGWCVYVCVSEWERWGVFQHPSLDQYYPARSGKTKLVDLRCAVAGSFQWEDGFTDTSHASY